MKVMARSALTVCLLTLAALCGHSTGAQAQTFDFAVCNRTNVKAFVALSHHLSVTDDRFGVEGWWAVEPGECNTLGTFPQGWFYYYAETTGGNWGGDFPLCVQYPGPFLIIHTDSSSCDENELKQFHQLQVTSGGTLTWNLNP